MATKLDENWVTAYFEHGVDVENRRVFLTDIDSDSVSKAVRGLYLMETESKTEPAELFICSHGGDVEQTLALYDILNTLQIPVHSFAYGVCMSAAPLLLASGEKNNRWISANTQFMIHPLSDELQGKLADLRSAVKYSEHLDNLWIDLLTKHSKKDRSFWQRRVNKGVDWYFSAEEALEYGLADSIWEEKSG